MRRAILAILVFTVCSCVAVAASADRLAEGFRRPPDSAKPWTYWFWMNGNITREGITADLEAMARVGIHGVLIMEVARPKVMVPPGPVAFASPAWRELFKHAVNEAQRLGMEIDMNNDAGWCGSGGPWNTPEFSMQKLVWTTTGVTGPAHFDAPLAPPESVQGFYRDLRVLAYPTSAPLPPAAKPKAALTKKAKAAAAKAAASTPASAQPIAADQIVDLSGKMDETGRLRWDAPAGNWLVRRIGHTSTGRTNHPAPEAGVGLECDKFSAEAMQRHFDAFLRKLTDDVGPAAGRALTFTHIDSWEVGVQNWTRRMPEEFSRRRGYDLMPWLLTLAGGPPIGSVDETRRFQRDFKRTESELACEIYAQTLRTLAGKRGLGLSIEAYAPNGDFINPLDYAAQADMPMAEFWVMRWGAWHLLSSRLISSTAHALGRPIVGAESFTATPDNGSWTEHPYSIKTGGDWAFAHGVNRFIFHRTVLQPWTGYEPGMTFGGYGTHFDRNQTWWEPGAAFMTYLARCQFLLQQGSFVADVCRLVPDGEEHGSSENHGTSRGMNALPGRFAPLPQGYNYDYLSDTLLTDKVTVRDGRIVLPSGMSYRVMQLPEATPMTPELLRRIRDLVRAGAIIAGPKPDRSPSLENYPRCDAEVGTLAAEIWGNCDGRTITGHAFGAGHVFWGKPMEDILGVVAGGPDFGFQINPPVTDEAIMSVTLGRGKTMGREPPGLMPTKGVNWIHRRVGATEIYFLANPQHRAVEANCTFRISDRQPELWNPESGEIQRPAVYRTLGGSTQLPIHFTPAGSVFVVFREPANPAADIVSVQRDGATLFDGRSAPTASLPAILRRESGMWLEATSAGRYDLGFANGRSRRIDVPAALAPLPIDGPWQVRFQPGRGAPESAQFGALADWAANKDEGIRHFSGTASYSVTFDWQPEPGASNSGAGYILDLGRVEVMADVRLNGTALGVLWKPPFTCEATRALKPGRNELQVKVTNLWVNRLVGDERFRDDCTPDGSWKTGPMPAWPGWFVERRARPEPRRLTFTTWKYYTASTPLLPSGLLGPVTLRQVRCVDIR